MKRIYILAGQGPEEFILRSTSEDEPIEDNPVEEEFIVDISIKERDDDDIYEKYQHMSEETDGVGISIKIIKPGDVELYTSIPWDPSEDDEISVTRIQEIFDQIEEFVVINHNIEIDRE